ncbi:hypothetical protein [Photobacterium carnosum]|uniref:hypothetical protein n=1 Tax=Photobacterium carnosum TaxID=2023717 RepID=UPI001E4F657D|nr:hypothetical protein [Photobacterium carnosum]MCD9536036.1 hypothetical protein [Photobacterium carnosum]MCF2161398.1 hypothetical protein [Photobacterium carnosum]
MTSLIAWVGVDARAPASVYLASDSRLSWSKSSNWDTGRKLFSSKNRAEILGYCGDVLFPSQKLGQIIEQIDNDLLISADMSIEEKQNQVFESIKASFGDLPRTQKRKFDIAYCTRVGELMSSKFGFCRYSWSPKSGWSHKFVDIPETSQLIDVLGSGTESVNRWYEKWKRSDVKGTSRSVFSAFCDSISSCEDPFSGGAPQLVGIYRKGSSKTFGIVFNGSRFLLGDRVNNNLNLNNIEWRNELFERCDGEQLNLLEGAQPQPRPQQLIS